MRKTIWTAWLQGIDGAPPLVRACIDSWVSRNPGYDVRIIDATTVEDHTSILSEFDFTRQKITPASFSDILRTGILRDNGGIWVDATAFCNRPLDDWLPDAAAEGFFAFAKPAKNRPMSSWFLAAEQDNPILARLSRAVCNYWSGRESAHKYFWFHDLIRGMLGRSAEIRDQWQRVPVYPATDANRLLEMAHMPLDAGRARMDWSVPVFKLSHKVEVTARTAPLLHGVLDLDRFPTTEASPLPPGTILDRLAPASSLPGPKVKIRGPLSPARIARTFGEAATQQR